MLQPMVVKVMPPVVHPISTINPTGQPINQQKIINKTSISKTKRKVNEDPEAQLNKKSLVKIAPKPSVPMAIPFLQHVASDSSVNIIRGNEMILTSSDSNISSLSNSNSNIYKDNNQTVTPSVTNSRPPCPVQLSAAIALSELAAKTGDMSSSVGENDMTNHLSSDVEFHPVRPNQQLNHEKTLDRQMRRYNNGFRRM